MDFKKFFSTYSGIKKENFFYRVVCLVLLASNLLLGAAAFARKEAVVLVPPGLKERVELTAGKADRKYQETWALFFALLLGNVTPRNVEFVVEELEKYLAPAIYQDLLKDVFDQAKSVKEANVSTSYEPQQVAFDEKTGRVTVKGNLVMRGAMGKTHSQGKTYEIGVAVKNYYPQIVFIDAYDVKPKEEKPDGGKKKDRPSEADKKPGH
jgi:conjugal transfer pilus assembly protein TraE